MDKKADNARLIDFLKNGPWRDPNLMASLPKPPWQQPLDQEILAKLQSIEDLLVQLVAASAGPRSRHHHVYPRADNGSEQHQHRNPV